MIVEHIYLLASDLAQALASRGAEIVGPFRSPQEARDLLASTSPELVLLAPRPGEENGLALADELKARGTPFLLITGHDHALLPERLRNAPHLAKPVDVALASKVACGLLHEHCGPPPCGHNIVIR